MHARGLLIDFDGTVLDSVAPAKKIVKLMCKRLGCAFDEARFARYWGYPLPVALEKYFREVMFVGGATRETLLAIWKEEFESHRPAFELIAGVAETIAEFRAQGIACVLATNRGALHLEKDMPPPSTRLETMFHAIQTWRDPTKDAAQLTEPQLHTFHLSTGFQKPDPRALWPALEWLSKQGGVSDLKHIALVGDSFADLEASYENGLRFIAVLTGTIRRKYVWRARMRDLNTNFPILSSLAHISPKNI